jgi:hypothetical protein
MEPLPKPAVAKPVTPVTPATPVTDAMVEELKKDVPNDDIPF